MGGLEVSGPELLLVCTMVAATFVLWGVVGVVAWRRVR